MKGALPAMALMFAMTVALVQGQGTEVGYYSKTCPKAETIVRSTVQSHMTKDPGYAGALLRLHFHDCFVQGCDASILIDGEDSERVAPPNQSLRGFECVHEAKRQLEQECPGIVSCADILALAARDSVALTGGINYPVPTGRKDGRISKVNDTSSLPGFKESVTDQKEKFNKLGLDDLDLVTLSGGHTLGVSSCELFSYRLYEFSDNGTADSTINGTFMPELLKRCPKGGNGTAKVDLDDSPNKFDTSYFANLRDGKGILESDQFLWGDNTTKAIVQRFLGEANPPLNFNEEFVKSMVKMGNIGIKTGPDGEIRKNCSVINSP